MLFHKAQTGSGQVLSLIIFSAEQKPNWILSVIIMTVIDGIQVRQYCEYQP